MSNLASRIVMVNDKIYGPSFGQRIESELKCLGPGTHIFTYIYSRNNRNKNLQGTKMNGLYPFGMSGWGLNTRFQHQIYRKYEDRIKDLSKDKVIHFTSQQIIPTPVQHPTVTVHDLIPLQYPEEVKKMVVKL